MSASEAGIPSSRRFRFSLRRMLLVIAVVVLALSHLLSSYRLFQANREIAKYRREMGYLDVSDPSKIHVVAIPSMEERTWRWRVYVPPGVDTLLRMEANDITPDGIPSAGGASLPQGESIVELRCTEEQAGEWNVLCAAKSPLGAATIPEILKGAETDWLDHGWMRMMQQVGVEQTEQFDAAETITLLRLRSSDQPMNQSTPPIARGLLVWLSPQSAN